MSENEIKEATIDDAIYCAKAMACLEVCEECRFYGLCHTWCDDVYRIMIEALEEIQAYRAIGTIEELQALKEKSVAKKPINIKKHNCGLFDIGNCPCCGEIVIDDEKVCEVCFQALDWQ